MRILVIPEDFRNDQYILKPIFSRLFRTLGISTAHVQVCTDPLLGSVNQATRVDRLGDIVDRYRMVDMFILCVDRDGDTNRHYSLQRLEDTLGSKFIAVNAWEEIETWVLAGLTLPRGWSWDAVRAEIQVKETYFDPLASQLGYSRFPGRGRKPMAEQASRRIPLIRRKCPEDFDFLALRITSCLSR